MGTSRPAAIAEDQMQTNVEGATGGVLETEWSEGSVNKTGRPGRHHAAVHVPRTEEPVARRQNRYRRHNLQDCASKRANIRCIREFLCNYLATFADRSG